VAGRRFTAKSIALALIIASFATLLYVVKINEGMVDFEVYRRAAGRALAAENLFRPDDGHYQYKYWPLFAFGMAPMVWVDHGTAKVGWYALTFFLLCVFVWGAVRLVPEPRLSRRALVWLAILFMGKFYARELFLGQTNILLGVILLGALAAAASGAKKTAGVCLALGVFVKPYALILVPWLLIVTGLQGVLGFAAALAVGLLAPALNYGWSDNIGQLVGWYRTVTDTSAPQLLKEENVSFATMWAKWIGPGQGATVMAIATSLLVAAVTAVIFAWRRRVPSPYYLEFGLLLMLVPVLSPQGWDYVLLLATPAILCVVDRWRDTSIPWRMVAAVGIFGMSFTLFDVLGRYLYSRAMQINVVTIAVLLILACLMNLRRKALA
jgi:hypothetical protein